MRTPSRPAAKVRQTLETCGIKWWPGYVRSEFYAAAIDSEGREYVVARSKAFPWRKSDPPPKENKDVRAAFDALSAQLAELGWKPETADLDAPWYARRFRREPVGTDFLEATAAGVSALRDRADVLETADDSHPAHAEGADSSPKLELAPNGDDLEPDRAAPSLGDQTPSPVGLGPRGGLVTLRLDAVRRRVSPQEVLELADRLERRGGVGGGLAVRIRERVEADVEYDIAVPPEERADLLAVLEELRRDGGGLPNDLSLLWLTLATPGLLVR